MTCLEQPFGNSPPGTAPSNSPEERAAPALSEKAVRNQKRPTPLSLSSSEEEIRQNDLTNNPSGGRMATPPSRKARRESETSDANRRSAAGAVSG